MHLRYRLAVLLSVICCLALTTSFAHAAKTTSATINSIVGKPLNRIDVGPPVSGLATCQLGQIGTPTTALDWLLPPNDRYFTLLDPTQCSGCGAAGMQLMTAKIVLDFVAGCTQPIEVSIVGSGSDPACAVPDMTQLLCPPIAYNLTVPASGLYEFSMPLPAGCCIQQRAFLQINFTATGAGCESAATRPYLVLNETCGPCNTYNEYGFGYVEWCSFGIGAGNPMMYVDAQCCNPVGTHQKSWGELKTIYR